MVSEEPPDPGLTTLCFLGKHSAGWRELGESLRRQVKVCCCHEHACCCWSARFDGAKLDFKRIQPKGILFQRCLDLTRESGSDRVSSCRCTVVATPVLPQQLQVSLYRALGSAFQQTARVRRCCRRPGGGIHGRNNTTWWGTEHCLLRVLPTSPLGCLILGAAAVRCCKY